MSVDHRRQVGIEGERLAAQHLMRLGFTILERNYRTRWGELDIVAFDGRTLCFCEVKARRGGGGGRAGAAASPDDNGRADGSDMADVALQAVTPAKRTQVRRMAARWLVERPQRPWAQELRFDAIGVSFDSQGRLRHLEHLEGVF